MLSGDYFHRIVAILVLARRSPEKAESNGRALGLRNRDIDEYVSTASYLSCNLGIRKLGLQIQSSEFSLGDWARYELHT